MSEEVSKTIAKIHHDVIVAMQAAIIEYEHGRGAKHAMQWIYNTLFGPGLIPSEDEPYGKNAQAYFDANISDPFPTCYCGMPSNILWMGKGYCCKEHHDQDRNKL